jgi:ribosomal protein S18 acetylase RimI-like enzyme
MHRSSSEVAIGRVVVAELEGAPIGGYVAVEGRSLSACRIADAIAALTEAGAGAGALRARMEASKHLFSPVPADAFYLSKLGVLVPHRGKGFARGLLARFLEHGRAAGFDRFRLDVHSGNERAIELYRRAGFDAASETTVSGTSLAYLAMELRR